MIRHRPIVIIAASLVLTGCMRAAHVEPTPTPIPDGTSPRAAILGREPTEADCFQNAFPLVSIPDPPTLQRHIVTAARRPAWLPSGGFLGTPDQLADAVQGRLIPSDPQTTWVLVGEAAHARADRWFPVVARSGERIWYRDGSVEACA